MYVSYIERERERKEGRGSDLSRGDCDWSECCVRGQYLAWEVVSSEAHRRLQLPYVHRGHRVQPAHGGMVG